MKKGDKIAYVGASKEFDTAYIVMLGNIPPKKGETATCEFLTSDGCIVVKEYPLSNGMIWKSDSWVKIDDIPFTNALTKELANDFIERDKKVREVEHEKVFSLTADF